MSTQGITLIHSANGTIVGANYYAYVPSESSAWVFVALFAGVTIVHFVLMFFTRAAFFIPLVIGGVMEAFGYYGRVWSSRDLHNFGAWALQAFMIICAPPMISATVYMALGRTIRALDARENALMSPRFTTPLFVLGDVIAFFSQLAGIGLQAARSARAQATGQKVVLAGLIFQLFLFAFFIFNIAVVHRRNTRNPAGLSLHTGVPHWTRVVYILYIAAACILLRNFVRVIEYAEGGKGQISVHEAFIYVFDATLMWVSVLSLAIAHPGWLTKRAKEIVKREAKDAENFIPMT